MMYSTHIYLYIEMKTYSPINFMVLKCMCNSSSLNSFFEHPRDISLKWLFYCDSLPFSLSFIGSVLMRLTHFILLDSLCMVYLHFGFPGEKFPSSKHLFGHPYPGISSWQLFHHILYHFEWFSQGCDMGQGGWISGAGQWLCDIVQLKISAEFNSVWKSSYKTGERP